LNIACPNALRLPGHCRKWRPTWQRRRMTGDGDCAPGVLRRQFGATRGEPLPGG
jgi:hypothetical protein